MLSAVAALGGRHQRGRVAAAAVESDSTGGVVGCARCHVAVLPCHLHCVKSCSIAFSPGEVAFVQPAVHVSSEVCGLAGS